MKWYWYIMIVCSVMLFALYSLGKGLNSTERQGAQYYTNAWGLEEGEDRNMHLWKLGTSPTDLGIVEISIYPEGTEPTEKQVEASQRLVILTIEAVMDNDWYVFDKVIADGYVKHGLTHWIKPEYIDDGHILNPDKPECLMYYKQRNGTMVFVGVMYLMDKVGQHGEQIGGNLTTWHYHVKRSGEHSAEMLHVWTIDHPHGRHATAMGIPQNFIDALN